MKYWLSLLFVGVFGLHTAGAQTLTGTKVEGIHGFAEFWFHKGSHTATHGPFSLPGSFWETPVTFTERLPLPTYIHINQNIQHIINVLPTEPVLGPLFKTKSEMPPSVIQPPVYGNFSNTFFFSGEHGEGTDVVMGFAQARVTPNSIGDYQYQSVGRHLTGSLIDLCRGFKCSLAGEAAHVSSMLLESDGTFHLTAGFFGYTKNRFRALYLRTGPNGGPPYTRVYDLPLDRLGELANGTHGVWDDPFPPGQMYNLTSGNMELVAEIFDEPDKVGALVPIPCETMPNAMLMHSGELFDGDLASLTSSDDNKLRLLSDSVTLEAAIGVFGRSPYSNPSAIEVHAEMAVGRPGLACQVHAYSPYGLPYLTGFIAPIGNDETVIVPLPEPWRYVNLFDRSVGMEIRFGPINDEDPAQDGWLHDIDLISWVVTPSVE